jgi:hypothetical protein
VVDLSLTEGADMAKLTRVSLIQQVFSDHKKLALWFFRVPAILQSTKARDYANTLA